jgi:hypothetical protein
MQARQREAVLDVLTRNQHEHVKIDGNGGHLGGAVTEEDVRTFVREFQVDQVRFLPFVTTIVPSITFALLKGAA